MTDPLRDASESGWIADHREQYLADGAAGHLFDTSFAGGPGLRPTLLLTTRGCKSGAESVMPLLYAEVDGGYAIIASKGGDSKHPGWYHNLKAMSGVKVQIANAVFQAHARVVAGAERARIWQEMAAMYPPFNDYQSTAAATGQREIPVIVLEPVV